MLQNVRHRALRMLFFGSLMLQNVKHRAMRMLFFGSLLSLAAVLMSGCSGTILSESSGVIATILATLSALSGVAVLIPGAAAFVPFLNAVLATAQEVQKLEAEYKTTPDETTLEKIEDAIQLGITNLQPLLTASLGAGVPAATAAKFAQLAQVLLNQFEAWASYFVSLRKPAAPPAIAGANALVAHAQVAHSGPKVTTTQPLSNAHLQAAVQQILETKTGDVATDEAFAKVVVPWRTTA